MIETTRPTEAASYQSHVQFNKPPGVVFATGSPLR
jgi:hypothetical protein